MPRAKTRRDFLQNATAVGIGFWVSGGQAVAQSRSANEKLNIAIIGVEGQGGWNLGQLARTGQNIVALCDAHESRAAKARRRFPKARFCADFRGIVDRKDVDAVLVATPDHVHAPATMAALRAGKHVYCEKPLTHTVFEARQVAEMASRMKRVTQMGTQIHAGNNYRRVVELIESKAIGAVREVHVWVGKAWVGHDRPTDTPVKPPGLHYDLWLGPAPHRPYHPDYLPAKWRGWWDFGGGTLADMACHYCDLPFWALKLKHPHTIEADGPTAHPESAPAQLRVRYAFGARGDLPPVTFTWHHGGLRPAAFAEGKLPSWKGDGVWFVGDKGSMLAGYNNYKLLPEKDFAGFKPPEPYIPNSIGHHREWIEACKTGGPTTCNFAYSGALSETVLLGNVAHRSGVKLEWDAKHLKVTNSPEAQALIHKPYRAGWVL